MRGANIYISGGPQPERFQRSTVGASAGRGPTAAPPLPAGGVGAPEECQVFYDKLNRSWQTGSFLSLAAPLGFLLATLFLSKYLVQLGPVPVFDVSCPDPKAAAGITLIDASGRLHFVAAHIAFLALCGLLTVFALNAVRRVLRVHGAVNQALAATVAVWALGGAALYISLSCFFGDFASQMLRPFFTGIAEHACETGAGKFEGKLLFLVTLGVGFLTLTVLAFGMAAAAVAWRYEPDEINGSWSNSYVLREKLNALLTLFVLGSALLVVANIAFGALLDWSVNLASAVKIPGAAKEAAGLPDMEALRGFSKSAILFGSLLSSALLITMFVPAFVTLLDDIDIAGRTHAAYDMHQNSPEGFSAQMAQAGAAPGMNFTGSVSPVLGPRLAEPYRVAGWKQVNDWKEKHGLAMSMANMTAAVLAVSAPILSSGAIDLSKSILGAH